ncbi:YbjN domain-containing protein [Brevundimonas sp.]|uniref:YbjN domain-containing protein n=1 Tax=Brevundimonas sp. TaxID=1871086 RepID=UPI0025E8FF31|nr:YbjN domain-containing protein [Brevundimonas sp.]
MFRFAAAAAAASLDFAGPALAQAVPEGGLTAAEIHAWLVAQGLDAEISAGEQPMVSSGANGVSWDVVGFDCEAGRCGSWQFSAGFLMDSIDPEAISNWNRDRRFLKAFAFGHDEGAAAVAQYDVLIVPGMTYEGLTEHLILFATFAPEFGRSLGWTPETTPPAQ